MQPWESSKTFGIQNVWRAYFREEFIYQGSFKENQQSELLKIIIN